MSSSRKPKVQSRVVQSRYLSAIKPAATRPAAQVHGKPAVTKPVLKKPAETTTKPTVAVKPLVRKENAPANKSGHSESQSMSLDEDLEALKIRRMQYQYLVQESRHNLALEKRRAEKEICGILDALLDETVRVDAALDAQTKQEEMLALDSYIDEQLCMLSRIIEQLPSTNDQMTDISDALKVFSYAIPSHSCINGDYAELRDKINACQQILQLIASKTGSEFSETEEDLSRLALSHQELNKVLDRTKDLATELSYEELKRLVRGILQ